MIELWNKIKQARKNAGLTQEELGAVCNPPVTKVSVGLWESGNTEKRTRPSYENLNSISKATKTPIEYFFSDANDPTVYATSINEPSSNYLVKQEPIIAEISEVIEHLVSHQLKNYYQNLPVKAQVKLIFELYNTAFEDRALLDAVTNMQETTLLKILSN